MNKQTTGSKKQAVSVLCWLLLLLAACSADGEQGAGPVLPVLVRQSPAEVVQAFLEAWNQGDYNAMYALVSAQSRERYPQTVFEARYAQVNDALGVSGIVYTIGETTLQGATAAVNYDVSIESPGYETLEDNGRIMRLIDDGGTWRVAWSSMDIISGYADGAQISVQAPRPPRGTIYDRNGLPLAQEGGAVVAMWSTQLAMTDVEGCITLLATVLREWRPSVAQRFGIYTAESVFFLGELDAQIYAQYSSDLQTLCGVAPGTNLFYEYTRRVYDWNGAALHVTGYLGQVTAEDIARGYSPGDMIGQMGVEFGFENELSGTPARIVRIESGSTTIRELASAEGSPASSVTLTLDRGLQRATAQAISDAFNYAANNWAQYSPGAAAIVMDVNTGEILALASYPSFDPALFDIDSEIPSGDRVDAITNLSSSALREPLRNHATQDSYFPGSTFKIITAAAALNEGLIAPETLFSCDLRWDGRPYGDTREFRIDWRSTDGLEAAGEITAAQALAASCNPFFYQFGALLFRDVGSQALIEYAQRMGLGAPTGLAPVLQEAGAAFGTIDSAEESLMSAVGQFDIQVTAIQMVRMMAGVANGGTLYQPYIVQQVGGFDDQPVTFEAEPTVVGNMDLLPETLQVVREGLCLATTDMELGTSAPVFEGRPYTICGKTGTAQTGTPYPNGWYVAYAPREDPQIALVVVVPNSREGSETAAPIMRRILDYYFNAPVEEFPDWWFTDTYNVLDLPEGSTGG